jgi:phosphinothricin acetyltransferase
MMIRDARPEDAHRIAEIYNYYILNDICTFEELAISEQEMRERIDRIQKEYPFLILEREDDLHAYAFATQWKSRSAYRHTVELSVYVDRKSRGLGLGKQIYSDLIMRLKKTEYRRLIGGVALPNPVSEQLHLALGFSHSGTLQRVGLKMGKWIDVAYYQLEV